MHQTRVVSWAKWKQRNRKVGHCKANAWRTEGAITYSSGVVSDGLSWMDKGRGNYNGSCRLGGSDAKVMSSQESCGGIIRHLVFRPIVLAQRLQRRVTGFVHNVFDREML